MLRGLECRRLLFRSRRAESRSRHHAGHLRGQDCGRGEGAMRGGLTRQEIAKRAAQELREGMYVNLGMGIPTLVTRFIPTGLTVFLQSEHGILGLGPPPPPGQEDPDFADASRMPVTVIPGASLFSSAESFAMIRGRHLDMTILGAFP